MRNLITALLLFCAALSYGEDTLPPMPDGVNKERVLAFQAAIKANDSNAYPTYFSNFNAERQAIPKTATKEEKARITAALDAESKYIKAWRLAYNQAKTKANEQAVAEQEAANLKASVDAQQKAAQDRITKAQEAETAKQQVQAAGGFSDKECNIQAALFRKSLADFVTEADLERGLTQLSALNEALITLNRRIGDLENVSAADFAAYDKIHDEYTAAVATKSSDGIKGKRIAGTSADLLAKLAFHESRTKDAVVLKLVRININAYGKYVRDIKEVPASIKDLTEGYAECRWTVPFKHDPLPAGEPEFILLKAKGFNAPAIISNPRINGLALRVGSLQALKVEAGLDFNYNIRSLEGTTATEVWEQAKEFHQAGKVSEESMWPKALISMLSQGGFVK